jgi:hypothetical protein
VSPRFFALGDWGDYSVCEAREGADLGENDDFVLEHVECGLIMDT